MKKIVCVTLTTIMILLLLTGCGSKKNDSGSGGSSTSAEALLQDIWGAFNEKDSLQSAAVTKRMLRKAPLALRSTPTTRRLSNISSMLPTKCTHSWRTTLPPCSI